VFLIFRTLYQRSQRSIKRVKARKQVMVPYSIDLRERVLNEIDAGEGTQEEVARRFRVSTRWIRKLLARRAATGSIAPEPNRGGRKLLIQGEAAESLRAAVRDNPDATLEELRQATGFTGCLMTLWRALERLRITRKKSRCGPRSSSTRRSSRSGRSGSSGRPGSIRIGSFSSTRATPRRP
jgi:transposase